MIQQGQLWVYEYPVLNAARTSVEYYEVCAIGALTRHTHTVAALSTIYTIPQARRQRIAERLVGRICNQYVPPRSPHCTLADEVFIRYSQRVRNEQVGRALRPTGKHGRRKLARPDRFLRNGLEGRAGRNG